MPEAPVAPCAKGRKHTGVVTTGSPGHPAFPARWCYGLLRALPGDRACLPPSLPRSLLLENLTPASGRQDHTTSPSASALFVKSASASTAFRPNVRDDGQRPPYGHGTETNTQMICLGRKADYFSPRGWTTIWVFRAIRITSPRVPDAVPLVGRISRRRNPPPSVARRITLR